MALSEIYKNNCVSYYEGSSSMSGVFTDTLANLLANGDLDYSIFLNCGCDWSYLNTGCKGNHFSMYPDWVGGVLAIRQGPSTHDIKYVGSAVMSKTNTSAVFNVTKQLGDNSGFLNSRFLIDVIPGTYGTDSTYNSFDYAAYTGQKYGFNSCILQSTSYYRPTDTAHTGTFVSDYTALTGDNARRLTAGAYQILATNYNPYLADSDTLDSFAIGYLYMFFEIDGELIACRNIPAMPNTAQWQSWFRYTEGGTDVYVTIGTYDNAVTVGSQGALPSSDDVKGIYCYNYNGTCQNCYSTKNAVSYIANCYGIRWMVGNTGLSTAGDWRQKVCLGVMSSDGIIDHDNWLVGESAIQASDNPNKNTDYDHIPGRGPGPTPGPYDDDPWSGASFSGVGVGGAGAFAKCYYMTSTELANLRSWMNSNNVPEGFDPMAQIIGLSQVPVSLSGDDNTTVQFVNSSAVYDPGVTRLVDSGVNTQISMGTPKRYSLGSVDITRRMQERGEPYLDYDCQIELYLPLIGMFSLDTQAVMGRTITAEAVLDPISGTLAAYAYVSRDGQNLPIAYGSTTIGVDLPISAQQYSVSRAALKQANAQLGTSILSSTLSFIAAATAGGKGSGTGAKTATGSTNGLAAAGIREAGADYMKASQAGNVFGDFMQWGRTIRQLSYGNNTAIAGSFGGSTAQWSYPFTAYVKIIRPRYEKPNNYAHSQGVPCVQTKKVGSCTGFIQCIGVDVSGITRATDLERQAIQAALANGVFAGGGS